MALTGCPVVGVPLMSDRLSLLAGVAGEAEGSEVVSNEPEPLPLLELVAWQAFGTMCKTTLGSLAKATGYSNQLTSDMSLFDSVVAMVRAVLGVNESDALDVCGRRLANTTPSMDHLYAELLEMDEATTSGVLDDDDEKELHQEQKRYNSRMAVRGEFRKAYSSACVRVRPPAPSAPAKGKGRGNGRGRSGAGRRGVGATSPPSLAWPADSMPSHAEAKAMVPKGGFMWRSLRAGGWQSHFPPFPRMSASWHRYGEREALDMNLRSLWSHYCEIKGLPLTACSVRDLFSHDVAPAGIVEPATSSGRGA